MKINRVNKAFSVLEALIAILIVGFSMAIISRIQRTSAIRFSAWREEIDRLYLVKKRALKLYLNPPTKEAPIIKKYEKPEVKITSELMIISNKSSLKKFARNIRIVNATGEWGKPAKSLSIVTFILAPEKDNA